MPTIPQIVEDITRGVEALGRLRDNAEAARDHAIEERDAALKEVGALRAELATAGQREAPLAGARALRVPRHEFVQLQAVLDAERDRSAWLEKQRLIAIENLDEMRRMHKTALDMANRYVSERDAARVDFRAAMERENVLRAWRRGVREMLTRILNNQIEEG